MHTIQAYHEDTYRFEDQAKIIYADRDEKGDFLLLDKTIFYPQGGGQPSDEGDITVEGFGMPINHVRIIDGQIRHYTDRECKKNVGKNAILKIDQEKRLFNARSHTSGHLISSVVEQQYPNYKAIKGHHFPGQCYVEFYIQDKIPQEVDLDALNDSIKNAIAKDLTIETLMILGKNIAQFCPDLPYSIPNSESLRLVRIATYDYQPCAGTHVAKISELEGLILTTQKLRHNSLKIKYLVRG